MINMNNIKCIKLMKDFINKYPKLWYENIWEWLFFIWNWGDIYFWHSFVPHGDLIPWEIKVSSKGNRGYNVLLFENKADF